MLCRKKYPRGVVQEVMQFDPDAVIVGDDGFLRVDYPRLGLEFMTWDRWLDSRSPKPTVLQ
jgi:hypothetical protein